MKKIILMLSLIISLQSLSQQYESVVGVRGGILNSISYKTALNDFSVAEGIVSFWRKGILVTGLYNIQNPLTIEGEQFEWYYGGGAHIGFFNSKYATFLESDSSSEVVIGIDGVIGMEYTFTNIPLNLSLDFKPALNLIGYTGLWLDHLSLGVRYVIN